MNEIRLQPDENYCLFIILITFRFSVIPSIMLQVQVQMEWRMKSYNFSVVLGSDIRYSLWICTMHNVPQKKENLKQQKMNT